LTKYLSLLLLAAVFISLRLHAQNRNISGVVTDAETHNPVAFCSIILLYVKSGTVSDANGRFRLNIPGKPVSPRIVISYLGYKTDTINILPDRNSYAIALMPISGSLNEVVVTGVSKATLIRENPVSIMTVSQKVMEQTTESNIIDVMAKNVPGLNAVKTGPNISKPFIRGLGYNRVLTLYDGIRQEGQQWGDEHGIEVDAYNVEKAEVIKGPASLMYGSDAVAGVVSLFSSMPLKYDKLLHGKFFSEYQANNGLTGNGIGLLYGNDRWAFALRGSYREAKNYSTPIDGRVYNSGFRETNASSTVQYNSNNAYSNINLTLYNNLQGIPDGSRDSLTRKFTKQIYECTLDDIKNRPQVPDLELNSYRLSPLHQHIQHYRIYSNNHYKIGKGDMDFLFAFQQNIRGEYDHPTMPQQAGMYVRLNTFNYGFRYNAPTFLNIETTIGFNGMHQNNISKNATDFPIPDCNLLDAGGFVFAKWKKDKWTISGGSRYDIRYLKGNDFYTAINPATGFTKQVSPPDTSNAYLQFRAFNKLFTGTSLSLGATFRVNEFISLKANVAKGYRAPNITEFASNGLDPGAHIIYLGNRDFVPEFSMQEDVGADFRFENFSGTISLFNNNMDHYIYLAQLTDANNNPVVNAQGDKTYQYQQSSAQLYGMEATLQVHPTCVNGFSFDNSFAMIDGFNRKATYKSKGINGEYLPLIPPIRLLSSINQEIKMRSHMLSSFNFKAEADINAAQNRYLALNNTETSTPAFTLFNISATVQIQYSKNNELQFQIQVNNVFDKAYQSNLSRLKYFEYYSQSPNRHSGIYNMGRNICLKAIVPF
jgi:iron complex outermembrane receptor protein